MWVLSAPLHTDNALNFLVFRCSGQERDLFGTNRLKMDVNFFLDCSKQDFCTVGLPVVCRVSVYRDLSRELSPFVDLPQVAT